MTVITPDWAKDAVFYQIFPDRFAKSERVSKQGLHLEPWDSAPTPFGFKGGDLPGAAERLDYLQDLGITAIYFNPIFASASNHRYHTYDYYSVDPLLGGNAALREFLDAAHRRNIKVVLDGVFNHASRGFWQFHHVLETGDGSPYIDWFHFNPAMLQRHKHWGAYPTDAEQRQLNSGASSLETLGYRAWWNLPALPKFNTGTPSVREFLWNVAEHWIKFGIDGWRLDVASEIDDDSFWQEFRRRVKGENPDAYIVAEIWYEAQRWLRGDQFDATMNYMVTGALLGFLMKDRLDDAMYHIGDYGRYLRPLDGPAFANRLDELLGLYDPAINQVQLNLLDSHDTPRFLSTAHGDQSALKLGWLFLFCYPGAPCIYYGDEIGLDGGADPECRKSFPWDRQKWDLDLQGYVKELIALRKSHPALRRGTFERLAAADEIFAFGRKLDGDSLAIVINVSDQTRNIDLPAQKMAWTDGPVSTLFGEKKVDAIIASGQIKGLKLAPHSGLVLTK
ncbi:MAG TPA: glycoside hydrolase family 13 protein [Anaerolineales bacterium]|nr:glycoside hydrolase family 13 protein [Anaerolineales bacterium]